MLKLDNLKYKPLWTSHIACVKSCLEFLNIEITDAWLFGATGHAFILNIHEELCPSGPTAFRNLWLTRFGRNAGYLADCIFGLKSDHDFAAKQQLAWNRIRQSIDAGIPCYGWEMSVPEFYIITGYDETGYYYSGCDAMEGAGPKPWQEVGNTEIGVMEMYTVHPGIAADDERTVRQALSLGREMSQGSRKWFFPKYSQGLAGYDAWIGALESGKTNPWGASYNGMVWAECRTMAAAFLKEVSERLDGDFSKQLNETAVHYAFVAENLRSVAELFPFPPDGDEQIKDADLCKQACDLLRKAKEAESEGMRVVEGA